MTFKNYAQNDFNFAIYPKLNGQLVIEQQIRIQRTKYSLITAIRKI